MAPNVPPSVTSLIFRRAVIPCHILFTFHHRKYTLKLDKPMIYAIQESETDTAI